MRDLLEKLIKALFFSGLTFIAAGLWAHDISSIVSGIVTVSVIVWGFVDSKGFSGL